MIDLSFFNFSFFFPGLPLEVGGGGALVVYVLTPCVTL
jgi:hypothetical protein